MIYKIRNKEGLYSTGGTSPRWTKKGKSWSQLNHVRSHITLVKTISGKDKYEIRPDLYPYNNCVLVTFQETEVSEEKL